MKLRIILQVCLTGTGKFTAQAESNHHLGVSALQMDSGDLVTVYSRTHFIFVSISQRKKVFYSRQLIIKSLFTFSGYVHSRIIISLV